MQEKKTPLRVFVAMPGTDMGSSARWKDPEHIKKYFLQEIQSKLKENTNRTIDLVIEKDKVLPGLIHASMFKEAWDADVYIADLTGNNPNVYLELGVRWAMKDAITVVVSQDIKNIKFNAATSRAIEYGQDPDVLEKAIQNVVSAIVKGLETNYCDSLVRLNAQFVTYSKEDVGKLNDRIKQLEDENNSLRAARGLDYLNAGKSSKDPGQRLLMFRKALEVNETLVEGYLELAIELRKFGPLHYKEAIAMLNRALSLDPKHTELYRELGVLYNKEGQYDEAEKYLREAVRLTPKDAEAWANLGGVLRRLATKDSNQYDWRLLREARDSYEIAVELDDHNSYALGNVARMDLLLSKIEPSRKSTALNELDTLRHICFIKIKKNREDYWLRFDLADSFLLSGEVEEGHRLYKVAINYIEQEYGVSVLSSVIPPLEELLLVDVLTDPVKSTVQKIVEELNKEIAKKKFSTVHE